MAFQLPPELNEHILSFADRSTRAAICTTNRLGRTLGTPFLYKSIGISDRYMGQAERAHRLTLLCRTLLENPRHAALPDEIVHYLDPATQTPCEQLNNDLADLFERRAVEMNLPTSVSAPIVEILQAYDEERTEHTFVEALTEETYVVLMFILCTRVSTLDFAGELNVLRNMGFMYEILQTVRWAEKHNDSANSLDKDRVARWHGLHTIREVHLTGETLTQGVPAFFGVEDIEPLLRFPYLIRLHAHDLDRTISAGSQSEPWCNVSNIKELKFSRFSAKTEDLEFLLPACYNLRTLEIEFLSRENAHRRFDWPELGVALREHCPNLEHLRIDHERDSMMDDEDMCEMGALDDDYMQSARLPGLGSLKELFHLRTLKITKNALFGTRGSPGGFQGLSDPEEAENVADHGYLDSKPRKQTLAAVLPASLRHLTIICEEKSVYPWESALLDEPGASQLDEMIVMDCQKDAWFSKTEGPNNVQMERERQKAARQVLNAARRAALVESRSREPGRSLLPSAEPREPRGSKVARCNV